MADTTTASQQQQQEKRESEDEKRSLDAPHSQDNHSNKESDPPQSTPVAPKGEATFKSRGVIGVEAMARSANVSKKGRYSLYALAVLIYMLQWVVRILYLIENGPSRDSHSRWFAGCYGRLVSHLRCDPSSPRGGPNRSLLSTERRRKVHCSTL